MLSFDFEKIDWEKVNDLIPVIIQNASTGKVLMLGYMNKEALKQTISTEMVTFYSRTKQRLWTKGETSGNYLRLCDLSYDCDGDTLLALVNPDGPTCHTGAATCFEKAFPSDWEVIETLEAIISERLETKPEGSYTAQLVAEGTDRVAQKVGEEAVEVVIAAIQKNQKEMCSELADLLFHVLILLRSNSLSISDVVSVLKERMS